MLNNYLKIALRNLKKYRGYSFINISGLAIGMASCMLILIFVKSELSYDRFHKNANQIYRVALNFYIGTNHILNATGPVPLAKTLVKEYPEVEAAAQLYQSETYVRFAENQYREERFYYADSSLFNVFSLFLLQGDMESALRKPNEVLLTPATARKYFGNSDPIGKTLILDDGNNYEVSGIIKEMPINSHFHFDFLASISSLPLSRDENWISGTVHTYFVLKSGSDPNSLESKFENLSRKYVGPIIQAVMGVSYDQFTESGNKIGFFLQPLLDIHLHSDLSNELEPNGSSTSVFVFSAIALVILILACVNFVNLTTARSFQRAKEVGIRKVAGSRQSQLVWQFLGESFILSSFAILIASGLVWIFLPKFGNLLGKEFSAAMMFDSSFLIGTFFVVLLVGIVAGSYPAFVLASFRPVDVLKGQLKAGRQGRQFRNVLVICQFVITIALFITTIIINQQIHYFRQKDMGIDREHVLVIQNAEKLGSSQPAFKQTLKKSGDILNVSYSSGLPHFSLSGQIFQKEEAAENQNYTLVNIRSDAEFMNTYRFTLQEGRYFSQQRKTDTETMLINQAAAKALNMEDPIGQKLILIDDSLRSFQIIGIINDFHLQTLHETIRPMVTCFSPDENFGLLSIRIRPNQSAEAIAFIQEQWNTLVPDQPMEFAFFDERFDRLYRTELRMSKTFTTFSILAIFIACLGLFGLASFTAERRIKEIGIRKILGAPISTILTLMIKGFLKWIIIANIIAWPAAYLLMNQWLQNFAYRIDIGIGPFFAGAIVTLIIALATVSYQSIKAALANPVDSLHCE